ncbi:Co2+/Mg2+ efflux protein ApaG [Pedobacter flavus]|uniref:Co2+/Mg2+ efflux protein ApaG n=1 Tax=Pedobacter flavus TaxID=3113906 RepID=A0ABU7GZN5_9SPHI|nr:Co2+/Mg2+ efflux protein ApaG [Pedobacter sp. VNH31]MEE1884463.1 Co2+/Mg2+ efflux protein ApaG [Pedobacter sp. VNH31]
MVSAISEGIKISIETMFQEQYSNAENDHFMFAYKINIENLTDFPVQLMSRKWFIFDSIGETRIVEGEGVVGLKPILTPNESYTYVSGCQLKSEIGSMRGKYSMLNLHTERLFDVEIPEFELIVPFKLN